MEGPELKKTADIPEDSQDDLKDSYDSPAEFTATENQEKIRKYLQEQLKNNMAKFPIPAPKIPGLSNLPPPIPMNDRFYMGPCRRDPPPPQNHPSTIFDGDWRKPAVALGGLGLGILVAVIFKFGVTGLWAAISQPSKTTKTDIATAEPKIEIIE